MVAQPGRTGAGAEAALERGELQLIPPPPDRDELLALYEAAW